MLLQNRDSIQDQGEPDEVRLLREILAVNLRVSIRNQGCVERSVEQLLERHGACQLELEAKGLKVVNSRARGRRELFIDPETVRKHLLRDTRWRDSRIDQVLVRLHGAIRDQQ